MDILIRIILLCTLFFVLILARSIYEVTHFKVKRYKITTDKKVGEGIKLAFISDLHNCKYGDMNEKIQNSILKENVDFLLFGGDLICGKRNINDGNPKKYYGNATDFLRGLSGKVDMYYTYGNHETRLKNRQKNNPIYKEYMEGIKDLKITFLNNETVFFEKKDSCKIVLRGIEIKEEVYKNKSLFRMQDGADDFKEDKFNLLVAHTPELFGEYADTLADLVFCGHNHGGTIRLPVIRGLVTRDFKLFPKYSYGIYEKNNTKMLVTGGLGDHTIHFRLFNMPEIVIVEIKNKF